MPSNDQSTIKHYNIFRTAELLDVHERTVRYWIRKKWVTPRRDYRNYPVFTDEDIKKIKSESIALGERINSLTERGSVPAGDAERLKEILASIDSLLAKYKT